VALLEKRRYLNNRSGDFPQVILIVPSHVPNSVTSQYLVNVEKFYFTKNLQHEQKRSSLNGRIRLTKFPFTRRISL
jgi:hypothetical protein